MYIICFKNMLLINKISINNNICTIFKKYNSAREEEWKCDFKKLKDGYKVSNYRIITNS